MPHQVSQRMAALLLIFMLFVSIRAYALPSFARQTNQECATCHIGSFGPQLTPYGMKFKIGGYTEKNVSDDTLLIPLSAMALAGYTNTGSNNPNPPNGFGPNNTVALTQAAAFLAGRLYDHLGAFVEFAYDGVDNNFKLDTTDIRLTTEANFFDTDMVLGFSVNNDPTFQDPFNSTYALSFPFAVTNANLAQTPGGVIGAHPVMNGLLSLNSFGFTAYTFLDNGLYAEFGGYMPASPSYQLATGAVLNSAALNSNQGLTGFAPYWRMAYLKDMKTQMYSLGFFGMSGNLRLNNTTGTANKFFDWGVDANYQYLGNRQNIFALAASYTNESLDWGQMHDVGNTQNTRTVLQNINLTGSYYYDKSYGANVKYFNTLGVADTLYYQATLGYGASRPDSSGMVYQVDWTPFGKEDSWGAPYANFRMGLQYTTYYRFNGVSSGSGQYNTLFLFTWLAI